MKIITKTEHEDCLRIAQDPDVPPDDKTLLLYCASLYGRKTITTASKLRTMRHLLMLYRDLEGARRV